MKKSEIIREGKKLLESRKEWYVCHAVEKVCGYYYTEHNPKRALHRTGKELTNWIEGLLNGRGAYGCWLERYYPDSYKYALSLDVLLIEPRLAWMDWMIEYWEGKGE